MKKVSVILAICLSLATVTSNVNLQTTESTSTQAKTWKDYPFSLVNNTKNKSKGCVKILTPALMQKPKHVPQEFTVFAAGKVEGVELALIDENDNGKYDEIGTDLMVIGKSPYGVPLSRIININNKLYECQVSPNGEKISLSPYEGKYGVLDFITNFKCRSKLDFAILNSDDIYIDAANDKNILLPCGTYKFRLGYIQEGTSHLTIKQNEMQPIEITDGLNSDGGIKTTSVNWGAPFRMDFEWSVDENKVKVVYKSLKVFGSANEEYFNFFPSLSPQIEVIDSKGQVVAKGAFPGC